MNKKNFFSSVKGFFKCLFCMKRHCSIKFHPEIKKNYYLNGEPYTIECKKTKNEKNENRPSENF